MAVLLGNGDGTLRDPTFYPAGDFSFDIHATDLDGDALVDLLLTNKDDNNFDVRLGNGDGTFGERTSFAISPIGRDPRRTHLVDVNDDGSLDFVAARVPSVCSFPRLVCAAEVLMRLTFAGAADTVTGSCHLLELGDTRLLLDCGLFQGPAAVRKRNREAFPFDPASLDWVLLSHAHLDHTGRLPLLVRGGFQGQIVTSAATRELTRLILLDSAKIQQADAERARRKGILDQVDEESARTPLYEERHVYETLNRFGERASYAEPIQLGDGIEVTFRDAGHVVGSAFIEIEHRRNGSTERLTFSGDLGNVDKPIVRDPQPRVAAADALLLESTYGGRDHRPFAETVRELGEVISTVFARGGTVVIPAFALERSQELLYVLDDLRRDGVLGDAPIFLDSPMAIEVTGIVSRYPECFDAAIIERARQGYDPFSGPHVRFTRRVSESKDINNVKGPSIIVSASGMCTGGRILHHLRHRLPEPVDAIVFIGYQAVGTTGREIVDGAKTVRIHGREVPVAAEIHTIGGFSGHAGQTTLLDWWDSAQAPERTFLVHGEDDAVSALQSALAERFGHAAEDPAQGDSATI